jgi:HD-GYP domain-containing protein (c-di-GMP phosphodiesterase class II)
MIIELDDDIVEIMESNGDKKVEEFYDDLEDAKDHGKLVSNLAIMLSRKLGDRLADSCEISRAGMVHDIGKLQIGKYLYGRQTDILKIEEMKYIRMHPELGFMELKNRGGFSDIILGAVCHHHENYDGSGYPGNLKGEEIPYAARILRICDVYAALISERVYRPAYDEDTAMTLMIDEVKHFDMKMFLAFMSVVHSSDFDDIRSLSTQINEKEIRRLNRLKLRV